MRTATPAETATWLGTIADRLERSVPAPLTVYLTLEVSQYKTELSEAARVVAVDAVASALGMTAGPTRMASLWEQVARRAEGLHYLSVLTSIAAPQLCACGAACTHRSPSVA